MLIKLNQGDHLEAFFKKTAEKKNTMYRIQLNGGAV